MNTMFWLPITESELERVIKSLRGKSSAGFDEIPEYLVKRCSHYIKKLWEPPTVIKTSRLLRSQSN
jgi:hypothetical protein